MWYESQVHNEHTMTDNVVYRRAVTAITDVHQSHDESVAMEMMLRLEVHSHH